MSSVTQFISDIIAGEPDIYVMTFTLVTVMVILLFLSFPMIVPLAVGALIGLIHFSQVEPGVVIQQMVTGISPNALIAVPMFILAADIMTRGNTAYNLLGLIQAFVGHLRGGLPITTCISCTLFGSVSGSTQATVVSVGQIMRPKLLQAGYKDSFVMALIINASDIAFLIPPSIGLILYGTLANASVGELFIAGIGPGLVLAGLFSLYSYAYSVKHSDSLTLVEKTNRAEKLLAIKQAILPLGFPALIIGGIYSGIVTPTEAASFAVLYAIIVECLLYRKLGVKDICDAALNTGLITAVVFVLVGIGQAFSWYISFEQIPQELLAPLELDNASPEYILFIIALTFFVGCMFVDSLVVLLILTPIFMPIVNAAGIDPILVGVMVTLQMAIGSATPPFGCDIFTAIAIFERPYMEVIRGTLPFFLILILMSALLIFFPEIALLPRDILFN
ncbi:Ectoine/5-hydroxyectoine TRAP transporter large permease protein UehC [Vibrio owensii]|uniref:TRAP transporter large permease n=1 Tax=Vibrio TaxID=662 RepID=UPI00039F4020|nr:MULTISPECIES: TRAP transporter large permease [Vibrio]CAH1552159.1 Ectoine/5-hydroxyectoine TRAP transporter large permease protein UehC [Vibrio owensii]NOJ16306.1 TRAP transporter large permease [Vibrio jasicida]PAW11925.1 TRAP transporter large permease [Vibrio sp. V1B]PQJ71172.1 C4-dicarboxylate ABC transporter permease [Vibrio jasicida]UQA53306.1 TRAP transporter large permease [Vibrio sp. ED002]